MTVRNFLIENANTNTYIRDLEKAEEPEIKLPTSVDHQKGKRYTMEYYSAIKKNSFESVLMRWMKLEPIIQSEVSQKDKDHYNILTHIYGI